LIVDYRPEKLEEYCEDCNKAGMAYAGFVHQEKVYQMASSAYLASLIMGFKEKYPDESNVSLDTRSKASPEWQKFIKEYAGLLVKAGRAWVKYEDAKRRWETERSLLALRREEFKKI
jgi:hypothetical protein